ncbi:hypothetical protein COV19_05240 [Candidatus Woesearchaeota archaeon CG10_big_fil_rev_8_21_14_0_10_44_13]|nr:MAG: hypothetical protein COV19_05240 [Candidatus Woesearchaeota archaeon CG10_big_fil_rev_8_21_14_0_10_44_13]
MNQAQLIDACWEIDKLSLENYISSILAIFNRKCPKDGGLAAPTGNEQAGLTESGLTESEISRNLFRVLTSSEFNYLGKGRSACYKEGIERAVISSLRQNKPLDIYLDLGGGYHASMDLKNPVSVFDTGLGELLVLHQIKAFAERADLVYPYGIRFHIIIDNMCANLVNGIPLERTLDYCSKFRSLISSLGMSDLADIVAESENFDRASYDRAVIGKKEASLCLPTRQQHENVMRFSGKKCTLGESMMMIQRYKGIIEVSESLLANMVKGSIHLTQRHTDSTICFRAFPGGDSRIQCGQVVVGYTKETKEYPFLLTSRCFEKYGIKPVALPSLPDEIPYIIVARRKM